MWRVRQCFHGFHAVFPPLGPDIRVGIPDFDILPAPLPVIVFFSKKIDEA